MEERFLDVKVAGTGMWRKQRRMHGTPVSDTLQHAVIASEARQSRSCDGPNPGLQFQEIAALRSQ